MCSVIDDICAVVQWCCDLDAWLCLHIGEMGLYKIQDENQ